MIDDARIGGLLLVSLGDVVEVQHGMSRAIQLGPREIELRARTVHESEHILIELHGLLELASRHIVTPTLIPTELLLVRFCYKSLPQNVTADEQPRIGR
jgi:hypothetical protein